MILFVFATLDEAESTLQVLDAKPDPLYPDYYHFSQGSLLISGIGTIPSASRLLSTVHHFKEQIEQVINLGFAADLREGATMGEVHPISEVKKHTLFPDHLDEVSMSFYKKSTPSLIVRSKGRRLSTSDYPIHDLDLKQKMKENTDLVDMEGYGIAYVCKEQKIPLSIYKITSDFGNQGGRALIEQHKKELSLQLSHFILKNIL